MGTETTFTDSAALRRIAEKTLEGSVGDNDDPSAQSPEAIAALVHELRVHQIELEMQNEELRRIYGELEKTQQRYSHLYDFSPVGYFSVSEKGVIEGANLTIASMLKMDRSALIGRYLSQFVLKDDQDILYTNRRCLLETRAPQACDLRLVKTDGQPFDVRLECMILESQGADCIEIRAAVSDITESKRAENDRETLRTKLIHAQKMESIGTLAGGIAHEFNNMLSIIVGNNELIIEELPEWSQTRDYAEQIRVASLRAADVVRQLLLFSRQTNQEKMPVQIGAVVKESLKMIRSSTPANIAINQNIADDVAPVLGNTTQINQLLINLCGNATDAMVDTGGTITIDLDNAILDEKASNSNTTLRPGRYVKLRVGDTGHGMNQPTLDRIFEPYFTTKAIGKGTGIGLAVVHGIVEEHNGDITAESSPGKGTRFTILLPAHEGPIEQAAQAKAVLPTGHERILFVDDEPPLLRLGKQRLKRLGYAVQGFTDPSEALATFKKAPDAFDLIITDMAMPHMTGGQLAAEILKIRPGMRIMLCTGYSESISEEKAREFGIRAFVMKPMEKADFAVSVRNVLDEAKGGTRR